MKTLLLMLLILPVIASAQTDQLVFFTGSPSAPDLTPELFTSAPFEQVELHFGILNPSQTCVSGFETVAPITGSLVAPMWTIFACGANP
ncbi:hypothetical protein KDK88_06525, partial [bacterium]|nr:hypothetical protein [bacterium]